MAVAAEAAKKAPVLPVPAAVTKRHIMLQFVLKKKQMITKAKHWQEQQQFMLMAAA